jgi:hypothetical protein
MPGADGLSDEWFFAGCGRLKTTLRLTRFASCFEGKRACAHHGDRRGPTAFETKVGRTARRADAYSISGEDLAGRILGRCRHASREIFLLRSHKQTEFVNAFIREYSQENPAVSPFS